MGKVEGTQAQFRGIKGNSVDQFKNPGSLAIIIPAELKSGEVIYPFEEAGNWPSHLGPRHNRPRGRSPNSAMRGAF